MKITPAQARALQDAIEENGGVLSTRIDMRVWRALSSNGMTTWQEIVFRDGTIGGRRVVTELGKEAAQCYHAQKS